MPDRHPTPSAKTVGRRLRPVARMLRHGLGALLSLALMLPPAGAWGESTAPAAAPPDAATAASAPNAKTYNPEQLDAMLAPIALYPDDLLVQMLMAATYPVQIVEAARWLKSDDNKSLKGDALAKALAPLPWDPSVKSIVPFPQVLEQMDQHLDWTQEVGYAMANQQEAVLDSVQRLRRQAQEAGHLETTKEQVVSTQTVTDDQGQPTPDKTIVIQPADPQTVYVPAYNPSVVYGSWPYPSYPPVYYPPPAAYYPGYYPGAALATGLAFATGVAVVGSLWGWGGASWGYGGGGSINVNRERYNNISVNNPNRGNFNGSNWRASNAGSGGRQLRAPGGGPAKAPGRIQGLPANAVGRPNVQVPRNAVNRPNIGTSTNRPAGGNRVGTARPGQNRPGGRTGVGATNRPNPRAGGGGQRAAPRSTARATNRGAFGGMNDGARAGQFQNRGSQSRAMQRNNAGRSGARTGGAAGGGAWSWGGGPVLTAALVSG